ncbi:sugar ABC transporter permease, partial [Paenibacillus sp. TAF58]
MRKAGEATFQVRFKRDFLLNKYLYLMMVPVLAYYFVFHYAPMYGALIAFKEYT